MPPKNKETITSNGPIYGQMPVFTPGLPHETGEIMSVTPSDIPYMSFVFSEDPDEPGKLVPMLINNQDLEELMKLQK
jgi:hypothetical protein